jgi:hypothetical protein
MTQQMALLTQTLANQRAPTNTRQNQSGSSGNPRNDQECSVCSSTEHRARSCPVGDELVRDGKCIRSENGRLLLPNGNWLPRNIQGKNLKEKFEAYHNQNVSSRSTPRRDVTPPPVSNNIFEIFEETVSTGGSGAAAYHSAVETDSEDDSDRFEVLGVEAPKPKKKLRFDGVELPARKNKNPVKPTDAGTSGNTHSAPPVDTRKPTETSAPPTGPRNKTDLSRVLPNTPAPPQFQPQYRYQSPIEDPAIAKTVVNRALDIPISISQRELFAISSDVRRHIKDLTTSRKVVNDNNAVEVMQNDIIRGPTRICENCDEQVPLTVSRDSVPLRAIFPTINDKHTFECVPDTGSMVVSMRRNVWELIGIGLDDHRITMQSANRSHTETLGRLVNLKFTFGTIDVWLQVQVVEEAAYEILLGKPFFTLTSCVTHDFPDGSQHLTITDPNSDRVVTIPTFERNAKNYRKFSDTAKLGFR